MRLARPLREERIRYTENLAAAEDYALWVDAMRAGLRFENLPQVLTRYRRHRAAKRNIGAKIAEAADADAEEFSVLVEREFRDTLVVAALVSAAGAATVTVTLVVDFSVTCSLGAASVCFSGVGWLF